MFTEREEDASKSIAVKVNRIIRSASKKHVVLGLVINHKSIKYHISVHPLDVIHSIVDKYLYKAQIFIWSNRIIKSICKSLRLLWFLYFIQN